MGNFIAMLAGGILLVMIVIFLDKVVYWPWLAQHLLNDRTQTLTVAFFVGVIISGLASVMNNR